MKTVLMTDNNDIVYEHLRIPIFRYGRTDDKLVKGGHTWCK